MAPPPAVAVALDTPSTDDEAVARRRALPSRAGLVRSEELVALRETFIQRMREEGATDEEVRSFGSFAALVESATPEELAREREKLRIRREVYGGDMVAEGRAWLDGTHPLAKGPDQGVIPTVREILRSLQFVALARGYTNVEITVGELEHAMRQAEQLATRPDDEPAALFFVLARQPGTLLDAWPTFPRMMARNHARTVGVRIATTDDELEDLAWAVCLQGLSFEQVREWFRERAQ